MERDALSGEHGALYVNAVQPILLSNFCWDASHQVRHAYIASKQNDRSTHGLFLGSLDVEVLATA